MVKDQIFFMETYLFFNAYTTQTLFEWRNWATQKKGNMSVISPLKKNWATAAAVISKIDVQG